MMKIKISFFVCRGGFPSMDIISLCAQVEARRAHTAFLAKCEEEYQKDMECDSPSEEEEEDEDDEEPHVHSLNEHWSRVFTDKMPRNYNAFQPIHMDDFAMLLIRQTLHRCVQEKCTRSQTQTMLLHTWQTCETEKSKDYLQPNRYKRITWASTWAIDLIFIFQ